MTEAVKDIGYMYQFAANLADGMSLTMSGNFKVGESVEAMNVEIDRLRSVIERQRARNDLELLGAQVEDVKRRRAAAAFDLEQYHANKTVKKDPAHVARMERVIEEFDADIAKGSAKLAITQARAK